MDYKEEFNNFIHEMTEGHLREFQTKKKEQRNLRKEAVELSKELARVLENIPEEERAIIENYHEVKSKQYYNDTRHLYLCGIKDGIKMKKDFEL